MADKYFSDIRDALEKFSKCVDKDLEEIRRQKVEMQKMKLDVQNMIAGKYVRDDKKVIISAPEIVIGNVDQDGMLKANAGASHVIIRANTIDIEGVGTGGSTSGGAITQKASVISQIAVDPGIDGTEAVVGEKSQIINQARSIVLCSSTDNSEFISSPVVPGSGISLVSESELTLASIPSVASKTEAIKARKDDLKRLQKELKEDVAAKKKAVDVLFDAMNICLEKQEQLPKNSAELYANLNDIDLANKQFDTLKQALPAFMNDYVLTVSRLAETNRQLNDMYDAQTSVDKVKSNFKKEPTGSVVNIKGERINLTSTDGDANLRTNEEASINMQAQTVNITSLDDKDALMYDGLLNINTRTIDISTADKKAKDDKNWQNPAMGDVNILTHDMKIEGFDYETKDGKETKTLTKEGKLSVRMERVEFLSNDEEGKSNGSMSFNAKDIQIKSTDVDKDKLTDKKLASGSTMVMASEKMYAGILDDKNKSKQVQLSGETIGVIAQTTAEIQQNKAVVQLDGGKLAAGGSNTDLYGKLTVKDASDFKGAMTAGKATIDNLEAKTSFKSKNISDGIAVPGASSSASLNAKIKEENPPKKESKS